MLDKNTTIEQLIYTAGGTKQKGIDNADFGTYSLSKGLNTQIKEEIEKNIRVILKGDPNDYKGQYITRKVLKKDAVPHGIFTKKYKESDYETKTIQISSKIQILSETKDGDLRRSVDYSDDYRNNPSNAPYRLAAAKLSNGQLMIVKERAINRIYSNRDDRTGNYFAHAYIFPKGVELSDINIDSLVFRDGLEKKEWGKDGIEAPTNLPTVTLEQMKNTSKQEPLSIEDLLEIYKKTSRTNKDYKSRLESKTTFNKEINKGTNLLQLKCYIKQMALNQLNSTGTLNDFYENIITDLEYVETPLTKLLDSLEMYINYDKKLNDAYENDNKSQIETLKEKLEILKDDIGSSLDTFTLDELKEVVKLQQKNLRLTAEINALSNGKTFSPLNGVYKTNDDYKATTKLDAFIMKEEKKAKR